MVRTSVRPDARLAGGGPPRSEFHPGDVDVCRSQKRRRSPRRPILEALPPGPPDSVEALSDQKGKTKRPKYSLTDKSSCERLSQFASHASRNQEDACGLEQGL